MLHIFKNISRAIGYNTKIGTDGVEWGRVNIWLVIRMWYRFHSDSSLILAKNINHAYRR